jgi:hypothetical protein
VALTRIGVAYGMDALQTAHANLGWLSFAAFMAVFWRFALRPDRQATATTEAATQAPGRPSRPSP